MDKQNELIAQFIEISGGEESVARFYLSSSNWSLEDALSNFLGNQAEDTNNPTIQPANVAATSNTNASASGISDFERKSTSKPRFATLNDTNNRDSDEEEGQAFYAGGSERSGQQVLGPPKKKNFREQLTDMFRIAQEQRSTDASPAPSTSSGVTWGQGMRLGMTGSDHSAVGNATNSDANQEQRPVVILKLWRQGFSIDNGELRLYDDPENKKFLETVMRGEIPTELLEMGWMVNVDVEDHRQEDYKQKPVTQRSFRGSGHTLGSPVPNVECDATSNVNYNTSGAKPRNPTNLESDEKIAREKLHLDTSAPTTLLQIRLADGTRISAQFNLTHTIGDIHQYIQNARPQYENQNYILVSSFPTRELTDEAATIEGSGLRNAAIMQRLK